MNPDHHKILKHGVDTWTRWRGENPDVQADLFKADLSWAKLNGVYLFRAVLAQADLVKADLSWADLRATNLREAHLREATLFRANLSEANLSGAIGLTEGQINSTEGDADTRLPKGIHRPAHWEPKQENHT